MLDELPPVVETLAVPVELLLVGASFWLIMLDVWVVEPATRPVDGMHHIGEFFIIC